MKKIFLSLSLALLILFGVVTLSGATSPFQQSIHENQIFTLTVFPNPIKDKATLTLNLVSDEVVNIEFFDITGKKVKELDEKFRFAGEYKIQIQLENMKEGIYFCKVSAGKKSIAKRLIIRH